LVQFEAGSHSGHHPISTRVRRRGSSTGCDELGEVRRAVPDCWT